MDETTISRVQRRKNQLARIQRRHNRIITLALFVCIALFFVINLIARDRSYSEAENRSLAQFPAFSLSALKDGSYFSGLSDYVSDQFFARNQWISLKLKEDQLLGRKESGGVYLCRDGYLMLEPETPDEDALAATASAMNAFAAEYSDLNTQLLLAPGATVVLSDKLPKNAPVRDQYADMQNVYGMLSGISVIDVTDTLKDHAAEYIYYKTDHHWTSLGAYYAFRSAADQLGISAGAYQYAEYTVADDFQGTLASKSGSHSSRDTVQVRIPDNDIRFVVTYNDTGEKSPSLYQSSALDSQDKYTVFFGGNHPQVTISTTAGTERNLLIFKDSYANCFIQYLTSYYDNIVMIDPRYYYDDVSTVINAYGITDVLFLYSANTLLTDTSLADCLNAAMEVRDPSALHDPAEGTAEEEPAETASAETEAAETGLSETPTVETTTA